MFEFLPDAPLVLDPGVDERRTAWLEQVRDAYEHRRTLQLAGGSHPAAGPRPLEPCHLYLDEEAWERHRRGRPAIALVPAGGLDLGGRPVPRFHEDRNPAKALAGYLRERLSLGDRVVLTTATHGRPQWLRRVERALGASVQPIEAWSRIPGQPPGALTAMAIALSAGFTCPGLSVIAPADVDGAPLATGPGEPSAVGSDAFAAVEDLRPGDRVVHLEHGA